MTADTVVKANIIRAKYSAGPNFSATSTTTGASERDQDRRNCAGDERTDGTSGERRTGAAVLRHQIAFERGGDGRRFARSVEQDRRRRAAVHGAVIDAGKHDQCAGGVELDRQRHEHRDRERGSDSGQDADKSSERDADEIPRED